MSPKMKKGELVVDYRVPKGKIEKYCIEEYQNFYYLGFVEEIHEFEGYNFLTIRWLGSEKVETHVDSKLIRKLTKKEKENAENYTK